MQWGLKKIALGLDRLASNQRVHELTSWPGDDLGQATSQFLHLQTGKFRISGLKER